MPRSCRMQLVNYSDYCVLTDLDLRVSVDAGWHPSHLDEAGTRLTWTRLAPVSPGRGWHPSHLDVLDARTKQSRIVLFRHNRDCSLSTNLSLTPDKQVH